MSLCDLLAHGCRLSAVLAVFLGLMAVVNWSCARHFWDRPSDSPQDYYDRCKVWRANSDQWLANLALALLSAMVWLCCQLARWLLGC